MNRERGGLLADRHVDKGRGGGREVGEGKRAGFIGLGAKMSWTPHLNSNSSKIPAEWGGLIVMRSFLG